MTAFFRIIGGDGHRRSGGLPDPARDGSRVRPGRNHVTGSWPHNGRAGVRGAVWANIRNSACPSCRGSPRHHLGGRACRLLRGRCGSTRSDHNYIVYTRTFSSSSKYLQYKSSKTDNPAGFALRSTLRPHYVKPPVGPGHQGFYLCSPGRRAGGGVPGCRRPASRTPAARYPPSAVAPSTGC